MRRVLIVGGGFGGLNAALVLQEALAPRRKVELTLVTNQTHFLFTPLLPNAATGDIEPSSISVPLDDLLTEKTRLSVDQIHEIDLSARVARGEESYPFDYLILSPGSVTRWEDARNWADREGVFTLKTARDAVSVKDRISQAFKEALADPDPEVRRSLLTFVIAGSGPTGISLASEIKSCIDEDHLADYPTLSAHVEVVIVEEQSSVLPYMPRELSRTTQEALEREGFTLKLGRRVVEHAPDHVTLDDGEALHTRHLFWCGGVAAHPLLRETGLPLAPDGRVYVDDGLHVSQAGVHGIYVIGDAAHVPNTPWTAQIATQHGRVAASNVLADLTGRKRRTWSYEYQGDIITLGRRNAAGTYRGRSFEGKAARALYRVIYTALVPSSARKMLVLRDWLAADFRTRPTDPRELLTE